MTTPSTPRPSFQIILNLTTPKPRLDQVLLDELRKQDLNIHLKNISRSEFKELFKKKRIRIKGQNAVPSSSLAQGSTTLEIIGYKEKDPE